MLHYTIMDSPIGPLAIVGTGGAIRRLELTGAAPTPEAREDAAMFGPVVRQLQDYFAGRLRAFDVALNLQGTPFQLRVWHELMGIPYGQTISYGELARRVGNPRASRAVGLANGKNPVPIIVPCHRVIGSSGALTGYGGGLPIKQALLELERGSPARAQLALELA